jgi:hypothetical protein
MLEIYLIYCFKLEVRDSVEEQTETWVLFVREGGEGGYYFHV